MRVSSASMKALPITMACKGSKTNAAITNKGIHWRHEREVPPEVEVWGVADMESGPLNRKKALRPQRKHDGHEDVDHHRSDGGAGDIGTASLHEVAQQRRQKGPPQGIDHPHNER